MLRFTSLVKKRQEKKQTALNATVTMNGLLINWVFFLFGGRKERKRKRSSLEQLVKKEETICQHRNRNEPFIGQHS